MSISAMNYCATDTNSTSTTTTYTSDPLGNTWWTPSTYQYYWPSFQPDKTRQAFQILKLLEDQGLVKITSVKKFIKLIDEIYKVL